MRNLILLFAIFSAFVNAQTVTTQFGQIQGSMNGTIYEFLGVPFAKPPVADLRWKAPENPESWPGILQTTEFAPACPQKAFEQNDTVAELSGNEDCLYLNIWTPQTGPGNLPVMIFIHGGGNQQGSASEITGGTEIYNGKNMAERGNAVVVTIQYRLGPLGYLVHPALEQENSNGVSGNYAVLDQILALSWVKNNIGQFGGDTSMTMIFGESGGGVNVGNLLTTPLASGLFNRACIQSAGPVIGDYEESGEKGIAFVDSFITSGTDAEKIAYLRTLPADSLIADETSPVESGVVQMNWQPVIDGVIYSDDPIATFRSGNFNQVPLIIGSNSEEMSISAPAMVTPGMVTALINLYFPEALQAEALALYPPGTTNAEAKESFIGMLTDGQFTAITRRTARCVSSNQSEPVWRYFFTHKHTVAALQGLGSYHGMELFYVFNNWENATLGSGPLFHDEDDSVQANMLNYWVNFARTGNPNGTALVTWPEYQASTDCYLEIKAAPDGSQCGLRTEKTDLWDALSGFQGCDETVETADLKNDAGVFIYPNPAQSNFKIDFRGKEFSFEIVDELGQSISQGKGSNDLNISCIGFQDGIYFVRILAAGEGYSRKIIISQ